MSMTIGRCQLVGDPYNMSRSGNQVSFSIDLEPTTVGQTDQVKATAQQLTGLVDNVDEPVIPVTWSEDSSLNGFYTVTSVSVPWAAVELTTGWAQEALITLEQIPGYANPMFETIVQAVARTNAHGLTVPPSVVAVLIGALPSQEIDLRGLFTSAGYSRPNSDGLSAVAETVYVAPVPTTVTQYRASWPPSMFYYGSARVEIKYGSTWYPVVGRNIPASSVWRISNGNVRLTSANGAAAGTLEVWDNSTLQWDSQNVAHWVNGAVSSGIGFGDGTSQPNVSILRNSPEQVTVRCGSLHQDFTYSLQRGAMHVAATWTCLTATKFGAGFVTANACTAITGGIRRTANDAGGNRLVFSLPVAQTTDLVNGGTNAATAATSGVVMLGVELAGSAAIAGNTASDLVNQFIGATSWRQRVVPR